MTVYSQLWRYAAVGVGSNLILFGAYILLTTLGMVPKVAMSLLYAVGVVQTFYANRAWTFAAHRHSGQFARYCAAYVFGYVFQLAGLTLLVDHFGLPHRAAQGGLVITTAGLLFLLQKRWVFRRSIAPCRS